MRVIVGVSGFNKSGKSTLATYLEREKGFLYLSVRNFLNEKIIQSEKENPRNLIPDDRDSLIFMGNELRVKYSPSYIADELIKRAKESDRDCVVESLRNPSEIEALREITNVQVGILWVERDTEQRLQGNIQAGGKETEISTFVQKDKIEMESNDPTKQNLLKCKEMAEYKLINNWEKERLYEQVDWVLNDIRNKKNG